MGKSCLKLGRFDGRGILTTCRSVRFKYLRPGVGAGPDPGLAAAAAGDWDHGAGRVLPEARRGDGGPGGPVNGLYVS